MSNMQEVRGTQSFVHVMSAVWRRPSVTALEIFWRWMIGAPILAMVLHEAMRVAHGTTLDQAALQAMTVIQPVNVFRTIHAAVVTIFPVVRPIGLWMIPTTIGAWLLGSAVGRTAVLRRLDSSLHARPLTVLVLGSMRAALLAAFWLIWIWLVVQSGRIAIMGPAAQGGEPNLVLYCAMLICGTLILYALWGVISWPLYLAPLLAMKRNLGPLAALNTGFRSTAARGKLIEINLVMNIVRIALIVLAMVFSASPLPFSNVETQTFLNCWWAGVILIYLAMSDYFHVVRSAAYLSIWCAFQP